MSENKKTQSADRRPMGGPGRGPGGHMGGTPVEKAKDFKGGFKRLIKYLGGHKLALSIVLIMAVGGAVFSIFGPKILGRATTELFAPMLAKVEAMSQLTEILPEDVVDEMKSGELSEQEIQALVMQNVDMSDQEQLAVLQQAYTDYQAAAEMKIDFGAIAKIIWYVLVLYGISAIFNFTMQFVMAKTSQTVVYDMRRQVEAKLSKLPLKYFDGRTHGEILSRVTNDIDTVSSTLQQGVTQVISSITLMIGITVMMFTISWVITLVCLVVIPMSSIFIRAIIKRSRNISGSSRRR